MEENIFHDAVSEFGQLNQNAFGYLLSSVHYSVSISNASERERVQQELDQLTYGLAIVYLFAKFEDYFPIEKVKAKHRKLQEYLAYRHIRHSAAHKQKGERASQHRMEFEQFYYASDELRKLIKWDQQSDTLFLSSNLVEKIREFLEKSVAIIADSSRS